MYIDEIYILINKITERKFVDLKLQLAIIQNPHTKDPQQLWKTLDRVERDIPSLKKKEEIFDPVGFEILKSKLRQNPHFIVKS